MTALMHAGCLARHSSPHCSAVQSLPQEVVYELTTDKHHFQAVFLPSRLLCFFCFFGLTIIVHSSQIVAKSTVHMASHVWCRFKSVLAGATGPRPCLVNLYPDGTVLVTCAGTEMGQGLFTKAKQVGTAA